MQYIQTCPEVEGFRIYPVLVDTIPNILIQLFERYARPQNHVGGGAAQPPSHFVFFFWSFKPLLNGIYSDKKVHGRRIGLACHPIYSPSI